MALVLVPPELGRPLLLYLAVFDGAFGCVLGQHDEIERKEQAIYYLKSVKGQALADHLAENPVGGEYEPLKMYFPDEEVFFIREDIDESYDSWRMFLDGVENFKGVGVEAILVLETGQHYSVSAKLRFPCTNNMAEYEAYILGINMAIDMNIQELLVIGDLDLLIHQVQGEWAISAPCAGIEKETAYYAHVEEEVDETPWFYDIKEYLARGEYPEHANHTQKCMFRRFSNSFIHSGGTLYKRTHDLGLLRCVDAKEASKLLKEIHAGTCGLHMNGFVLAKKILRAGYFWMTMETDCTQYVRKCYQCQVHADMIKVPPNELNETSSPWTFAAWEWMPLVQSRQPPQMDIDSSW
ncbi:uncharacterized protein [Nicotiana sylvestris]|uniref:uncharacterized protein n=1 Tax=Nicotiana sylvestris TaxID=4096 RepID=UPI00388C6D86